MYSALRSGLRASHRRPPARFICRRRYPSPTRARAFHASRHLAQGPTPPVDPGSKPVDENAKERTNEEGAAAQTNAGDAAAAEDADLLAQKLQRSREMTRRYSSALRRSQRRNRAQDLPPVVIPNWFLEECVRLSEEIPADIQPRCWFTLSLQQVAADSLGTCSIPARSPDAAVQLLSDFIHQSWGGRLGGDEKRRFVRQWAMSLGYPATEEVPLILENPKEAAGKASALPDEEYSLQGPRPKDGILGAKEMERMLHNDGRALAEMDRLLHKARREINDVIQPSERHSGPPKGFKDAREYVPSFVQAEIRATVAASLSALQPASSDSFPATKTNLILHCPSTGHDAALAHYLAVLARDQGADLVALHAQDLAEIAGDYLGDLPEPSPHSIRSLAYETYRLGSDFESDTFFDEGGKDEFADEQEDAAPSSSSLTPTFPRPPEPRMPISIVLPSALTTALKALQMPTQDPSASNDTQPRAQTQAESQLEDLKIGNVLEHLLDASETKRGQNPSRPSNAGTPSDIDERGAVPPTSGFFTSSTVSNGNQTNIDASLPGGALRNFTLSVDVGSSSKKPRNPTNAKIIHIPDFKELNATHYGGRIIQKLEEIVRKRRFAGESIMIIGSTSSSELTPELSRSGVQGLQSEGEAGLYRTIVVPVEKKGDTSELANPPTAKLVPRETSKHRRINIRHIFDMLRRLDPVASQHLSARKSLDSTSAPALVNISGTSLERILTYDEVHRIALTTLGLHLMDPSSDRLNAAHIALAIGLLQASDQVKFEYVKQEASRSQYSDDSPQGRRYAEFEKRLRETKKKSTSSVLDRELLAKISASATKHEKRLMPGIANPDQIKTTFDQVHVPTDTIESIRTLTSMSLLRPDAFNYGVLATEKISGALLYGPPGTGKTLLAKAVAKESGSRVLEVSGSQIMDKYVGEGEKNVTAIFSLARKLSPCIVFLDEADAIFSSRDVGRERTSHRDILNQFLKEWDGLNDLSVFVMVATNRPFDLDDAVIRRLPRRMLVDLPTQADRTAILKIHLRDEQLDESVDLEDIAKRTPYYSGSDLKNLAVSAALACVKEENEQAAIAAAKAASTSGDPPTDTLTKPPQLVRGQTYDFPEKRILHARHFDAALQEISASISENMSSLNAIKKFDEKYGDKKGKKTKHVFGIGVQKSADENAVRVRP